jgi:hypothetical protein
VGIFAGIAPALGLANALASREADDVLDERAEMADWDVRLMRWMHEQGLEAMRKDGDVETRALADACNCLFCRNDTKELDELRRRLATDLKLQEKGGTAARPVPGRGREGLG